MTDLRTVLDEQIGDLPPSTVDVRAILARQRRLTVVRRVAGGTAAAGAVTATAVALSVLPGGGPPTVPSGRSGAGPAVLPAPAATAPTRPTPAPALTPTPAPTCPGSPASRGSSAPSAGAQPTADPSPDWGLPIGAEGRLTAALTAAARPETRALRLGAFDDDGVVREPLVFFGGPCAEARMQDSYLATATVADAAGTPIGMFSVYVQAVPAGCDGCTTDRRPDGTVVRVRTERGDLQGQQQVRVLVILDKPDGTVVQLVADGPIDGRPALDAAALTRIGLAPGLTLHP